MSSNSFLLVLCAMLERTLTTSAPERCFKNISRLVEGTVSSMEGGGCGAVVALWKPIMATRIHGIRRSDETITNMGEDKTPKLPVNNLEPSPRVGCDWTFTHPVSSSDHRTVSRNDLHIRSQ
ncbi:hypothetical protein BDZ97DRAFT_645196 [Flammula alnicola]|nr:hypothetical protein BDZ97DRAFT_645196 [Flammula alnicola]